MRNTFYFKICRRVCIFTKNVNIHIVIVNIYYILFLLFKNCVFSPRNSTPHVKLAQNCRKLHCQISAAMYIIRENSY